MTSRCPGCAVVLPERDGPTHRYLTASPACWHAFGLRLAEDYSSAARMRSHQVLVDAYAAQHPGEGTRVQAQSVGLHLMTLCLVLEHGADPAHGPRLHQRMVGRPRFAALPRSGPGALTVVDVPLDESDEVTSEALRWWASEVWRTYGEVHHVVRGWLEETGLLTPPPRR